MKGIGFYKIMNTTGQKKTVVTPNKVLVTGAGLLGVAAIEKFLSAGWDVVGVSLRKDHENFFFDHQQYVSEMGAQHGFNYIGPTPGALNVLPAIGVYAAIRRQKGEPFSFPGGPSFVWEAADADLVADVMVWAAQSPQAANKAFNITNGDVFESRNLWPALAETLGVETGPDMPTSVAAYLEENADVWNQIVSKYDLRSRNLRQLVGQGDQHADFAFAYGAPEGPRAFVSTIKLRQAGFTRTIDTEDSFRNGLQSLIDHKLLPPAVK